MIAASFSFSNALHIKMRGRMICNTLFCGVLFSAFLTVSATVFALDITTDTTYSSSNLDQAGGDLNVGNNATLTFSGYTIRNTSADTVLNLNIASGSKVEYISGVTSINGVTEGVDKPKYISINGSGTFCVNSAGGRLTVCGVNEANSGTRFAMNADGLIHIQNGTLRQEAGWYMNWSANKGSMQIDAAGTFDLWNGTGITVNKLSGDGKILGDHILWTSSNRAIVVGNGGTAVDSAVFSGTLTRKINLAGSVQTVINVTKLGEGTQTFSGNTAYLGKTTVSGGTLVMDGNAKIGWGDVVLSAGTLDLKATDQTLWNLTGTSANAQLLGTGNLVLTTLDVAADQTNAYIQDTAKCGVGASTTYAGKIDAGNIEIQATDTKFLTLTGVSTMDSLLLTSGKLAVGNGGQITVENLSLQPGTSLNIANGGSVWASESVDMKVADGQTSQLSFRNLELGEGVLVNLSADSWGDTQGQSFVLDTGFSGTLDNLANIFTPNSLYAFNFNVNGGILSAQVDAAAVPEPGTWVMLTLGLLLVSGIRRKR